MNQRQRSHMQEQLIVAIDEIAYAIKKRNATPEEVTALPEIARVLNEIDATF